jgi:uncharacterized protein YcbX
MFTLSQIWIYPVKSLRGIELQSALVEARGLQYDRRWMIVNEDGRMLTQRDFPVMARITTSIEAQLTLAFEATQIQVPLKLEGERRRVTVWRDEVMAVDCGDEVAYFLSNILGQSARLVWMPNDSNRLVDKAFAHNDEVTSFSDGFPFLIMGEATVNDLNDRIISNGDEPIEATRFRPNFLFSGGQPLDEENWARFTIGEIEFEAIKPCSRCTVTTIDQNSGLRMGVEPLKSLKDYRKFGSAVYLGQNLLARSFGIVNVGDSIKLTTLKTPFFG